MSSTEQQHGCENPSFSRESLFELSDRQRLDSETQLIMEDFNFSDSPEATLCQQLDNAHHIEEESEVDYNYIEPSNNLPRSSVTTVFSNPIIHLEDFLSDARDSVQLSPDDLSQLSLQNVEVLRDENPR